MSDVLPSLLVDGPLLRGIPYAARVAFFQRMLPLGYPVGDVLFRENEPGDAMFIISRGEVSIVQNTLTDELVEIARIRAGDFVGELTLFSPAPRSATAIATAPTQVLRIEREVFFELLRERDPAARALLQSVARRLCQRIRTTDARIDLVHDALQGANPHSLEARLIALTGQDDQGPRSWRNSLMDFFGSET